MYSYYFNSIFEKTTVLKKYKIIIPLKDTILQTTYSNNDKLPAATPNNAINGFTILQNKSLSPLEKVLEKTTITIERKTFIAIVSSRKIKFLSPAQKQRIIISVP